MANTKKTGFRTVSRQEKKDYQRQLKEHRMQVLRRTVIATVAIFLFLGGTVLYMSLRQYTDYDVRVSVERSDTKATRFEEFQGNILKYSNDGALYTAHDNELLWTQTYEMANPTIDMCGNYLTIYDKKGKDIYILNKGGFVHSIKTNYPISHVSVAGQGTVAVLMENQSAGLLMLYDKEGNELVSGAIHGEKGGYPLAIALSDDGIKLGVSMLDVSEGSVKTSLAFYNFGSVGESAIDHMVSITGYEDVLMPELNFLSKDCMIAVSDGGIFVFEGAQSPKEVTKIQPAEQIKSVFYNEEYIGFVYRQNGETAQELFQIYDLKGKLMMEAVSDLEDAEYKLLSSNEVCITNHNTCNIYTIHGTYKFHYEFDDELYEVLPGGSGLNYTFLLNGVTEQVRLK